MNITLKNVKTFTGREGIGLNADVYVDGVKTFFYLDDATGGEADHQIIDKAQYNKLQAYADAQPEYQFEIEGKLMEKDGNPWMCKVTIDDLIDKAFEVYEGQKAMKKIEKATITQLIWGNADFQGNYHAFDFKKPLSAVPADTLQQYIEKAKALFKPGQIFWNKNLNGVNL